MIQTILQNSWKAFFDSQKEKDYSILTWIWLGFLLLLGLLVWGYFLNFGSIPFDYHDWAEINAPRIAFLKDAVTKGLLPLHMPDASALRGFTDRFMALPDVILSPQIILLRWLSVGDFVLVHTWLLYAIGFLGLFVLKQHLQLSLFSFTWLFFLLILMDTFFHTIPLVMSHGGIFPFSLVYLADFLPSGWRKRLDLGDPDGCSTFCHLPSGFVPPVRMVFNFSGNTGCNKTKKIRHDPESGNLCLSAFGSSHYSAGASNEHF